MTASTARPLLRYGETARLVLGEGGLDMGDLPRIKG